LRGLSVDVSVGTFVVAEAGRKLFLPGSNKSISLIIALSVFLLYLLDHYKDYQNAEGKGLLFKYRALFCRKPLVFFIGSIVLFVLIGLIVFQENKTDLIIFALPVACLFLLYLLLGQMHQQKKIKYYPREWIVAFTYTIGTWGYFIWQQSDTNFYEIMLLAIYFLILTLNTKLFSLFEREEDKAANNFNFVNFLGLVPAHKRITGFFVLVLLFLGSIMLYYQTPITYILMAMLVWQLIIYLQFRMAKGNTNTYYGSLLDAILLFPFLILI